ncbi:MAG: 16S rRNA (guanine(527)-N(7))-methyltransferase RsmG [Spirochaetes bacterium]|nr:16S rRNA (guanine(527)-N(7))-methyltransferase RsmG [Spirochaetota bacterium]
MERDIIKQWCGSRNISPGQNVTERMAAYAEMIHEAGQTFNLTGLKTKEAVLSELIIGSIDPLRDIIVPRGTRFVDIGTGAGIPGIALSIYFEGFSGLLIESSQKKAGFARKAAEKLGLDNVEVVCDRAESAVKEPGNRESFQWCFMRAFGKPYIAIELGAPFIEKDGLVYIYSGESFGGLQEKTVEHAKDLGLCIMSPQEVSIAGLSGTGTVLKKTESTPEKYPRRYAVIKREAESERSSG